MRLGKAFYGFDDGGALPFAPTFKMDTRKGKWIEEVGRGYTKKRLPSYCDRILSLHGPATPISKRIAQGDAPALVAHSDHAPVWAIFEMTI